MTITATVPKIGYTATGGTAFVYPFKISDAADILVYVNEVLTSTGFTVDGVGSPLGGNVTFTVAPANGTKILLVRSTTRNQGTDWTANDPDPAESKENAFDKAMGIAQEQDETLGRTLRIPIVESIGMTIPGLAARKDRALGFDTNGLPTSINLPTAAGGDISLATAIATGAITARSLATRFGDTFNILDYGADPTGVADSTAAIQACIDAAVATPQSGGYIVAPRGTYKIMTQLNVTAGKFVRLEGAGVSTLFRWAGGNNTSILSVAGTIATPTTWLGIDGIQFHNNVAATGLTGITCGSVGGVIFNVSIRNCVFNALAIGMTSNNEGDEFYLTNCWFTACAIGVRHLTAGGCVSGCGNSNHTYIGNHFINGTDWAVNSDLSAKFTFIGNTVQSNAAGAKGLQLDKTSVPTILSNYFEWQTTPTGVAVSINPTATGGDSLGGGQISDNVFNLNNAATGVLLANISGLKIGNNAWRLVTTAISVGATATGIAIDKQSLGTGVTTLVGGAGAPITSLQNGLQIGVPTGGDKGVGTLNIQNGLYLNNNLQAGFTEFVSADQTVTLSTKLTIAHGLGAKPKLVRLSLKNATAELNYSIGDEISMDQYVAGVQAATIVDATNIVIIQLASITVPDKNTPFTNTAITAANWKWVVRAWK